MLAGIMIILALVALVAFVLVGAMVAIPGFERWFFRRLRK